MPSQHAALNDSRWPWASILLIGTFGSADPASRRYHWRCGIALGIWILGLLSLTALATRLGNPWAPAILTAGVFGYIGFELWRLVGGLDELSRKLQLEAMAIAYLIGLPIFVSAPFVAAATGWSWQLPAAAYIGLDVIRGAVLAMRARKYR